MLQFPYFYSSSCSSFQNTIFKMLFSLYIYLFSAIFHSSFFHFTVSLSQVNFLYPHHDTTHHQKISNANFLPGQLPKLTMRGEFYFLRASLPIHPSKCNHCILSFITVALTEKNLFGSKWWTIQQVSNNNNKIHTLVIQLKNSRWINLRFPKWLKKLFLNIYLVLVF